MVAVIINGPRLHSVQFSFGLLRPFPYMRRYKTVGIPAETRDERYAERNPTRAVQVITYNTYTMRSDEIQKRLLNRLSCNLNLKWFSHTRPTKNGFHIEIITR